MKISLIKQTGFPSSKLEIYFIMITALMEIASYKVLVTKSCILFGIKIRSTWK